MDRDWTKDKILISKIIKFKSCLPGESMQPSIGGPHLTKFRGTREAYINTMCAGGSLSCFSLHLSLIPCQWGCDLATFAVTPKKKKP